MSHCLAEEVGRRHRNMPVSRGIAACARRSAPRCSVSWALRSPLLRGGFPGSRCRGFTHARGPGGEPARRVRERPDAGHDRPATGLCLVGGERGSAVTDSSEHRQQFCDSDAGLAQHQKVTARSTHPGLRGAAALSACPLSRGAAIPRASLRPALRHPKSQPTASPAAPALPPALPFPSLPCAAQGSARPHRAEAMGGGRLPGRLRGPALPDLHIFYWPLNKTFLRGSECIVFRPRGCCVLGQRLPLLEGPRCRPPPRAPRRHGPGLRTPREKLFFLVVSKFTGFNSTDLGPGPVPLRLQRESWRCPGCSRLHKPARFYFFH